MDAPQSNEQLDRVVAWLCAGLDDAQVARHVRQKLDPDATDEHVEDLIEQGRAAIADGVAVDRDYLIGRTLARLDGLYAMAVAQQDARTALAVQKELTRLLDLHA